MICWSDRRLNSRANAHFRAASRIQKTSPDISYKQMHLCVRRLQNGVLMWGVSTCPEIEQEGRLNHFQSLVSIYIVCDLLLGHLFAKFHSSC